MPEQPKNTTPKPKNAFFIFVVIAVLLTNVAFISYQSEVPAAPSQLVPIGDPSRLPQTDDEVFTDNFLNNDNNWMVLEEDRFGNEIRIFAGRLWISNGESETILFTTVPVEDDYEDFSMVVDAGTSSTGIFTYDIAFRADETLQNGYVFSIEPLSRTYRLDIVQDGEWSSLLDARTLPGINAATQNRIAIEVEGDDFRFSINDEHVALYSDDTFSSGKIMLAASSYEGLVFEPFTVSFDTLEIRRGGATSTDTDTDSDGDDDSDDDDSEADGGEGDGGGLAEPAENLVECVLIVSGGAEIFPEPDRSSGRVFAAAGQSLFAPHVAGISPDGDWVYIYYFDEGVATDGWVRITNLTLTPTEAAGLVEIDPDDVPPLPRVPYDSCVERPYGGATNAPIAGQSPVITGVTYTGRCDDLVFMITWADPDGNPSHIDVDGLRQEGIGGTGGTHISNRWECPFESCRARFTVIDLDGNRSNTVIVDIPCN